MFTYRISQTRYARLLTGSGVPARWNYAGRYVMYTGGSAALSCLEAAVHKGGASLLAGDFSLTIFDVADTLGFEEILIEDLVKQDKYWNDAANYPLTQEISEVWLNGGKSAILKVPSSIIQNEYNYLFNVNHPDYGQIKIADVSKFTFDSRLKSDPGQEY